MPRNFVSLFGSGGDVLPVAAVGGFAFIQQSTAPTSGTALATVVPTLPGAASSGSTVFLFVSSSAVGKLLSGVTGLGGTWAQLCVATNDTFDDDIAEIWWATNITGGGTTATATFVSEASQGSASLIEFSHSGAASLHAAASEAIANDAAPATNTVATTAGDLVVALLEQKGAQTLLTGPLSGFTAGPFANAAGCVHAPAWKLSSLSNPQGTGWTTSAGNHWAATIASVT